MKKRYILLVTSFALPALFFINASSPPTTSWNANSSNFFHQIGSAAGSSAWAVPSTSGSGFLTYGPYTTSFQNGVFKATFHLSVDNNTADDNILGFFDIFDNVLGQSLVHRDFHRRDFSAANSDQAFDLTFVTQGSNKLEFRVFYYGSSYVAHLSTSVTQIQDFNSSGVFYANQSSSYHTLGHATSGNSWAASSSEGAGVLTYGPYTNQFGPGNYRASFALRVDNNSADNLPVAILDINQPSTGRILAQRSISRKQFTSPMAPQIFDLPFNNDGNGALEFRVRLNGYSYVEHFYTTVVPNNSLIFYGADSAHGHLIGRSVGLSWVAESNRGPGFLTYGPYTSVLPPGFATAAQFRSLTDPYFVH